MADTTYLQHLQAGAQDRAWTAGDAAAESQVSMGLAELRRTIDGQGRSALKASSPRDLRMADLSRAVAAAADRRWTDCAEALQQLAERLDGAFATRADSATGRQHAANLRRVVRVLESGALSYLQGGERA